MLLVASLVIRRCLLASLVVRVANTRATGTVDAGKGGLGGACGHPLTIKHLAANLTLLYAIQDSLVQCRVLYRLLLQDARDFRVVKVALEHLLSLS